MAVYVKKSYKSISFSYKLQLIKHFHLVTAKCVDSFLNEICCNSHNSLVSNHFRATISHVAYKYQSVYIPSIIAIT